MYITLTYELLQYCIVVISKSQFKNESQKLQETLKFTGIRFYF